MASTCTEVDPKLKDILGEDEYVHKMLDKTKKALVSAAHLPGGTEYSVMASIEDVNKRSESAGRRVVQLLGRLFKKLDPEVHAGRIGDWGEFEDAIDNLFGRVDEAFKIKDAAEHKIVGDARRLRGGLDGDLNAEVADLPWRPQDNFKQLVDNYRPRFVPRLKIKHNSELPVPKAIVDAQNGVVSTEPLPNAYTEEIRGWQQMVTASVDGMTEVTSPQLPNKEAELMWVDTVELVDEMLDELAEAPEVAIDLEHHNMQSYRGFTCLIQIATRKKDYIVDVLAPGIMMKMHDFNRITSDPGIVKVLHGADMDVQWLQRDLSAYLVNMFDTGQAARVLELGGGYSLKNLLDFYCGFKADKENQVADWRQRPLSDRMKQYARNDVHYLLYIYDRMRAQLLCAGGGVEEGKVTAYGRKMYLSVINRSCDVALKTYKDADSDFMEHAIKLSAKTNTPLSLTGRPMLAALMYWRDKLGRKQDVFPNSILTDRLALRIAMEEPVTREQLFRALGGGSGNVARQVRENADEVLAVLKYAALHPKAPIPESTDELNDTPTTSAVAPVKAATPVKMVKRKIAAEGKKRTRKASSGREEPVVLEGREIEMINPGDLPNHVASSTTDVLSVDTCGGGDDEISAKIEGVRAAVEVSLREVPAELASTMYLARQKEDAPKENEEIDENPVVATSTVEATELKNDMSSKNKDVSSSSSPDIIHVKGTKVIPKSIRQAYANADNYVYRRKKTDYSLDVTVGSRMNSKIMSSKMVILAVEVFACLDPAFRVPQAPVSGLLGRGRHGSKANAEIRRDTPVTSGKRSAASQALKFIEQEFDLKDDDASNLPAPASKKRRKNKRQNGGEGSTPPSSPANDGGGFAKPKGIAKRQRR
ncbi:hypothetical protein FOL47_007513 [Perkinsus chesapeaki]|uniref:HRDC domain-containing protein n=1 Tax=Perkinsus chesapeaki TaxID=330153 RepID=A0A7J6LJW1_PERCH|nr:hypothetical protein FOL47_007513 [Perkinsus chesapeaki]